MTLRSESAPEVRRSPSVVLRYPRIEDGPEYLRLRRIRRVVEARPAHEQAVDAEPARRAEPVERGQRFLVRRRVEELAV